MKKLEIRNNIRQRQTAGATRSSKTVANTSYSTLHTPASKKQGFTIIEVILVLAIAGLIFLIVFLALPQLQRSRRDTQRKNDLNLLYTAFFTFQSNTGDLPTYNEVFAALHHTNTPAGDFVDYLPPSFNDPSTGSSYERSGSWSSYKAKPGSIVYYDHGRCLIGGTNPAARDSSIFGPGEIAVTMRLEQGDYCLDNQ